MTYYDRRWHGKGCIRMRMVKKKLIVVCVGMMFLAGVTGCSKTVVSSQQTQENNNNVSLQRTQEDNGNEASNQAQEDIENESDGAIAQEKKEDEADDKGTQEKGEAEKPEDATVQNEIGFQDGTEFLSGKIQSVEEDSMIIAQTTILEDGMVTLVDEKDAKKISVKFTEDTKVEHWTIKGGGADIDRKDAALSDLAVGMGVEMEGYYESEVFVAIRVLIEEYV